jgi:hypothetical protein
VLFVRFVELDASTEGKDVSLLWWFRRELARRGALPEAAVDAPLPLADAGVEVFYVKTFAVVPGEQAALAGAARRLVATQARHLAADGRVLVSEDGVRVALEWRWRGETTARLLRMARSCGRPWMTTRSSCVPRRSTRGCTGSSPPLEGASERTTVSPRRPCRPPVEARGSRRSGPGTRAPAGTTRRA